MSVAGCRASENAPIADSILRGTGLEHGTGTPVEKICEDGCHLKLGLYVVLRLKNWYMSVLLVPAVCNTVIIMPYRQGLVTM